MLQRIVGPCQRVYVFEEKIKILKSKNEGDIERDPQKEQQFSPFRTSLSPQEEAEQVVGADAAADQKEVARIVVSVKPKGHDKQPDPRPSAVDPVAQKIPRQGQRQE